MGLLKDYYDEYNRLADYDLLHPVDKHKRKLNHLPLKRFIGDVRDSRALEVGCAAGEVLEMIRAKEKMGCDIADSYLKQAARKGLKVFKHDAEKPFPRIGKFDVIILSSVIEHFLHPGKVVANLKPLLHERSRIFVLVPYKEDLSPYRKGEYKFAHLRSLDLDSLGRIFKGYRLVRHSLITPKNPFMEKKGIGVGLRKLFSFNVVCLPKRMVDRLFIGLLGMEASTLIAEYRLS